MLPLPHHYDVGLAEAPARYATITTSGVPGLRAAPPPAYDGPGDAWTPEHLLLAAVEACFLFTFRAVARQMHVEYTACALSCEGVVDRQDGVVRFTEIVVRPHLTLPASADFDRVKRALAKTERACLVSASLSTPIRVEPQLVTIASVDDAA
jgi:organic hydroperoxide reductase OsmC/OhrA